MSRMVTVTIHCDGRYDPCPRSRYVEGISVADAEQQAVEAGWLRATQHGHGDLCPDCRPAPTLREAFDG